MKACFTIFEELPLPLKDRYLAPRPSGSAAKLYWIDDVPVLCIPTCKKSFGTDVAPLDACKSAAGRKLELSAQAWHEG
ncbi:hypothetical protein [Mesobacterium pallidum]|uniref:hypothetical protein n=1 Tax=Mesobacterium pallidum TaxID=2872037 RepID=UPI001EE25A4D|nr:hypothetical protein [Mesobacterium pallidum]